MAAIAYVSLLDVPFVQEGLMCAYDLLAACEDAEDATDEIREQAAAFREWLEQAR